MNHGTMGERENKFVELEKLLSNLHDGVAGEDDVARIEGILDGDPEACEFYLDYTQMCAHVELEVGARQPVEISGGVRKAIAQSTALFFEGQKTKQILNPGWRPMPWVAAAAAVAVLAVAASVFLNKGGPLGPSEAVADEEQPPPITDHGVAIIMETVGAKFSDGSLRPESHGGILPLGELRLESGITEIEFYSGARVILEGPAVFELDSEHGGVLHEGRLRAQVPPQPLDFSISTPHVEAVLSGAEFAISIGEDGHRTEVHCFEGELQVFDVDSARDPKSLRKLVAEQALRFDSGNVRRIEANPMAFVSYIDLTENALANASARHDEWREKIEEMRADESILALYSFEDQGPRERALVNQGAYMDHFSHGAIVGCRWTSGRWPSKGALEFKRSSDRVRVHAPERQEVVTFSAWVRLDALPRRNSTLLASSAPATPGATEWAISRDGKMLLSVREENGKRQLRFQSTPVLDGANLGKWHHLATVFDRPNGVVVHYADGNEISRHEIPAKSKVFIEFREAEIGNFGGRNANGSRPVRHLSGRMDEFALFGRAYNGEELGDIYEVGKPQ